MAKKIIIIGSGLAGLSAGCYAAMNGLETLIFEHHAVPGGVAASWKRGGYTIDGGIHFVAGHKEGNGMHKILAELGAADPALFADMHDYGRFIHEPAGISIDMSGDIESLANRLKSLAPADKEKINEFFRGVRAFRGHDLSTVGMGNPPELASIFSRTKEMWQMRSFLKYFTGVYAKKISDYIADVETPWLKDLFYNLFLPESPVWFPMMMLAIVADRQAGFLAKGCLPFVLEIEKHYKALGGKISYRSTVAKILVENDKAVGVRLEDGQEFKADYVISAGDGYNTVFKLLGGEYIDDIIKDRYETWPPCRPFLTISYGVNREFKNELPLNTILLKKPLMVGNEEVKGLLMRIMNYSGHFAPAGKSVFQIEVETGFDYWYNLQNTNRQSYDNEKQWLAAALLQIAEKYYPGISAQVEVTDVATPYTTWRHTLNKRASWGGWLLGADNMMEAIERSLPGLSNFYMAGHWVMGGVPGVLLSGRHAVQLICRDEKKKFTVKLPT
ncbi:MAG: NAD(P)/FAD-dependent oxidoreductase [Dehalococcoidales bacterium]|nr:NAD(P)/FAD-dependent oxidoreductase [Dehalococcoidales bacterium]